jgi:Tfp pilus assembly protein PilF
MSDSPDVLKTSDGRPALKWTGRERGSVRWIIFAAVLVCLVGGYFLTPAAKRRVSRWNEERRLERAREHLKKGDYKHAFLDAKGTLDANPQSVEANRLIAKTLEAGGTPGALGWRLRLQSLRGDDAENLLALANDALEAGEVGTAVRAIESLKSADRSGAVFHEISARLATAQDDAKSAEAHWAEACRIDPHVDRYQINLAALRLNAKEPEARATALATLREIAGKPASGVLALRVLLADAKKFDHPDRVRKLADELVAAPGATFEDKLRRLDILRRIRARESSACLAELLTTAESNPNELYQLLSWMNQNDLAMFASEWLAGKSQDMLLKPPVCIGVAQIYVKIAEWKKLSEWADLASWGELDFLRRAFLANALEHLEEAEDGAAEWKHAVSAARSASDGQARLERLASTAQSWRWEQRAEDIFWELAQTGHSPRWVLDALWAIAASRTDTAQLQQVAGYLAKADPKSVTARNNYAFLCLLTHSQEGDPHRAAEALHAENPDNSAVAVTYALSLYQQNQADKAVDALSNLKPEELNNPNAGFSFYKAVFLIAADRGAEAEEFLRLSANRSSLPEEKAILLREKAAAAKRIEEARERAEKSKSATAAVELP